MKRNIWKLPEKSFNPPKYRNSTACEIRFIALFGENIFLCQKMINIYKRLYANTSPVSEHIMESNISKLRTLMTTG